MDRVPDFEPIQLTISNDDQSHEIVLYPAEKYIRPHYEHADFHKSLFFEFFHFLLDVFSFDISEKNE